MEISFIHIQIWVHLHVNKTNLKGFALGLALKQRRKATRRSPIAVSYLWNLLAEHTFQLASGTFRAMILVKKNTHTTISRQRFW